MIDTTYRCEICGEESQTPSRWIVIQCSDAQLSVFKWTKEVAQAPPRKALLRRSPRAGLYQPVVRIVLRLIGGR